MSVQAATGPRPNQAALRKNERLERWALLGLAAPALIATFIVVVVPVSWLFYLSVIGADGGYSMENYIRMVESKSYARIFLTTFQISLITTLICILIGYPLAYFLAQLPERAANLCMLTVLLPFWTSLLVRTYAWLVLLQKKGLINNWGIDLGLWETPLKLAHNMNGTVIGMVHIMVPFLILPVYGAMKAISRDYLKASANLGATPAYTFRKIFLPLSLPGLLAGTLIVFILCLGFYVTPAILGGGRVIMVSMQITNNIELFFNWGAASALGVVLFVITMLILLVSSRLLRLERILGGAH